MILRHRFFTCLIVATSALLYFTLHHVTNSINQSVKSPYMDEVFHVPQAQRYCRGEYDQYDSKLTTPPGLYVISLAILWLRDRLFSRKDSLICDTIDLRRTNHVMAVLTFMTIILIQMVYLMTFTRSALRLPKPRSAGYLTNSEFTRLVLSSLSIITLPPLFFFYSLYYTDIGSLLFTLLVYYSSLRDRHLLASAYGFIAVCFRQTNIVWVFYVACLAILQTRDEMKYLKEAVTRNSGDSEDCDKSERTEANTSQSTKPLGQCGLDTNRGLIKLLLKRCLPYAIVGASFLAFVIKNGGIVLGDKEAHQPRLHWAQILYFLGFCAIFGTSWIFQLRVLRRFLYFTIRSPLTAVVACLVIVYLISSGRYAHPYLLADNRHITFYIWRRILDRHNSYVPYMLTPLYLIASFSVWHHLRSQGCLRVLLFIFCCMLVIVPNGLFELRYFIIPYTFLRLHADVGRKTALIEIAQNILINFGMHYLFQHKTFRWADSQELQRIMW